MESYGCSIRCSDVVWCSEDVARDLLIMSKHIFTLLHWTWQLPQTLIGWFVYQYIKFKDKNCIVDEHYHKTGHYAVMTKSEDFMGGVSLGRYVFTNMQDGWISYDHEFGHSIQSLMLGPLYLIIIGLPSSLLAANISDAFNKRYYWFYTEKWADSIAGIRDSRDRLTASGRPRRQVNWWKGKMERK